MYLESPGYRVLYKAGHAALVELIFVHHFYLNEVLLTI